MLFASVVVAALLLLTATLVVDGADIAVSPAAVEILPPPGCDGVEVDDWDPPPPAAKPDDEDKFNEMGAARRGEKETI